MWRIFTRHCWRVRFSLVASVLVVYVVLQVLVYSSNQGFRPYRRGIEISSILEELTYPKISKLLYKSTNRLNILNITHPVSRVRGPNGASQPQRSSSTIEHGTGASCSEHVKLLRGFRRRTKGYLTIGLSTVPRNGISYLPATLASLHEQISPGEVATTVIVLLIASFNETFVRQTLRHVDEKYSRSLESGLLQVLQPERKLYPDSDHIKKQTFNDSLQRVKWRTKQNLDYAYLFGYSETLSEYFIQIEDDVITATDFIQEIRNKITSLENSKTSWFEISFSDLGFIGKLFRSSDLCTLSKYLILFQLEKPCDLLMVDLRNIMLQPKVIKTAKSLFQHKGTVSSLTGKVQTLVDKTFKDEKSSSLSHQLQKDLNMRFKLFKTENPVANISTSLETFDAFKPERAYLNSMNGFFWAKDPKENDFLRVDFLKPLEIKYVNITTGHPQTQVDILNAGDVRINNGSHKSDGCADLKPIGVFKHGTFAYDFPEPIFLQGVCIVVTKQQKTWLIVSEIHIAG